MRSRKVRRASTELRTARRAISSPRSRTTPSAGRPGRRSGDRGLGPDLGAERPSRVADRVGDAAGAAAGDPPGPERAVDLAHVVVEQDVGRARARTPWYVPMIPDADIVALSGSVSNHWPRKSAALIVMSWTKTACWRSGSCWNARSRPSSGAAGAGRGRRVGRDDAEDRLDEPGHLDHELAVLLVGLGIAQAPAAELADRPAVVVDPPEVVVHPPPSERGQGAVERQDVEAVLRQLELADDLRAEQADDVAGDAEPEAREDLLGDRRAAEDVALLEDDRPQAGAGEVGGADEAVVATADDDRVVASRPRVLRRVLRLRVAVGGACMPAEAA